MTSRKSGPIAWFAGNPVAANLLMLAIVVAGVGAGLRLPVQYTPDFRSQYVDVVVQSPGSSPKEVQEDIVRRLEEALIGLPGVERVVANASEGAGRVTVEMPTFADARIVLLDIRNAVDGIENFPPANAERPEVELVKADLWVLTLAVSSSLADEHELRRAAEEIRKELQGLPSVSRVSLEGTRDREVAIELSEEELRRHGLSFEQVTNQVRSASLNLTFGELRTAAGGVVLHTVAKKSVGEEFADIPIITQLDGTIVRLGEIAEVRDGFVDEDVRFEVDGVPGILISVDRGERGSVADVAAEFDEWRSNYTPPPNVEVTIWEDLTDLALERNANLLRNAMIGAVLVFVCLILVFDVRVAMWIALGIPFAFVGSLTFFGAANLTLNLGTIFAFFLLVGLVVDDAVVVGESIAAEREAGKSALEAAVAGTRAVVGPIAVAGCTTLLALAPLLFVTEGAYQIVAVFPLVALFVLAVSFIEAFLILPAHLSHPRRWSLPPLRDVQASVGRLLDRVRDRTVAPAAAWAVKHAWLTLACAVVVCVGAVLLLRTDTVRFISYDSSTPHNMRVDLHLPAGTPFATTLASAERIADAAYAANDQLEGASLASVSVLVGNVAGSTEPSASHLASVSARLNEYPLRKVLVTEIERVWRRHVGDVSHLEKIEFLNTRSSEGQPLGYALTHGDPEVLQRAAAELRSSMAAMPGVYDVADTLSPGKRHLETRPTAAGIAAGLTPAAIGAQLRANLHGVEVQRIQRGHEEIKVMMRYPAERRRSLGELADERIRRLDGSEVSLHTVANLVEQRELARLDRIDGTQAVLIGADVDIAVLTTGQARRRIETEFVPALLARYPGLDVQPHGLARSQDRLSSTLRVLVPVVLVAMYGLMAAFLRSYWKPLAAAAGFPLSFAGAVLFHWLLGWELTTLSVFGIIAVAGVVVNDTLVLLDRYRTIRRNGETPAIAAVAAATRSRFRAVLLTTVTTVVGLSPLLYERTDQLVFLVPFVVSMLGGLILSGVFTLFVLPALIMIGDGWRE